MLEALLQIQKKKKAEILDRILTDLRKCDPRFLRASLEVWGPVDAFQYDRVGKTAIHRYTTLLVRNETGAWFFVRQVADLFDESASFPTPCYVSKVQEHEAESWRTANRLHSPVLTGFTAS